MNDLTIPQCTVYVASFPGLTVVISSRVKKNRQNEAAKREMGVQLRKSKAWFGKSRDPQGFL